MLHLLIRPRSLPARRFVAAIGLLCLGLSPSAGAQDVAALCRLARNGAPDDSLLQAAQDRSTHARRRVAVALNVELEVLDWASQEPGPAVVWLPGANSTAHVFDDVATMVAPRSRQVAITPRGKAPSSVPPGGYDLATRVADVVAVLDSLGIRRAVFAGHSQAGDVLTALGRDFPGRVAGLVFIDAAHNRAARPPGASARLIAAMRRGTRPRVPLTPSRLLARRCAARPPVGTAEAVEMVNGWVHAAALARDPAALRARQSSAAARSDATRRGAAGAWPGNRAYPEPRVPVVLLFAGHATRETFVEPFALFADTAAVLEAGLWFDQEISPFLAAQRRAAIQAWPHAEAIVVPDGQHTLMWTHPRVVVDAVQRVRRRAAAPR